MYANQNTKEGKTVPSTIKAVMSLGVGCSSFQLVQTGVSRLDFKIQMKSKVKKNIIRKYIELCLWDERNGMSHRKRGVFQGKN